jgi:hypothetical protein
MVVCFVIRILSLVGQDLPPRLPRLACEVGSKTSSSSFKGLTVRVRLGTTNRMDLFSGFVPNQMPEACLLDFPLHKYFVSAWPR